MEKIAYQGWQNCYRLSNAHLTLIVTGDVGPRVIDLRLGAGENLFAQYAEWLGRTGDAEWHNYGGHRLWHAPEVAPRTYAPDNSPVTVEPHPDFVRFIQPVEATTGIEKSLDLHLDPHAARVKVVHRLRNTNLWAITLAPWALSVMAPGGVAIAPLPPRGSHVENLLPTSTLALWAYTNMADSRWTWGERYVLLRQDPQATTPQKAGFAVPDGWVAYARAGQLFVKTFAYDVTACYPDLGSAVELFTNTRMLEVETLGPLTTLEPGAAVEHVEQWQLFDEVPLPTNDADVRAHILPHVQAGREGT